MQTDISQINFSPRKNYSHLPSTEKKYDVIIVGTGVAGYASAMYASRLGLSVLIIGETPGGTLALTHKVENYPGFVSITGQKLTELLENHAMDYEVDVLTEIVEKIEKNKTGYNVIAGKDSFQSKAVIFATGTELKKLNIPGEKEFFGKGVSYCALCDAAFVKNKEVIVIGGGDSAVKEALLLTEYAKKITIINNEKELHPEESTKKELDKLKEKITIINNNEVLSIKGKDEVEKVLLKKEFNGKKEILTSAVFIYVGQNPKTSIAKDLGVKLNKKSEIIVNENCQTNINGFFAAGDVTNKEWKQAIIAVSQGVTAAYNAYNYCKEN
ncbi:MAG: NAD(P)/FAD-dependent oxidoreductase [Candidatus Nanoarchaeia archaeon]